MAQENRDFHLAEKFRIRQLQKIIALEDDKSPDAMYPSIVKLAAQTCLKRDVLGLYNEEHHDEISKRLAYLREYEVTK